MTTRVSVLQYTLGIAQTRWTDIIINIVIENNLIAIDATCSLKALEKISKLDGYVSWVLLTVSYGERAIILFYGSASDQDHAGSSKVTTGFQMILKFS